MKSRRVLAAMAVCFSVVVAFRWSESTAARQRNSPTTRQSQSIGAGATTTRLADGRLLILGGQGPQGPTWRVALIDPATRQTTELPARLIEARAGHSATLLPDGTVLVAGGFGVAGALLSTAERFDPATETFSSVAIESARPRVGHTATLLTDGRVLVVGGRDADDGSLPAEVWDPENLQVTTVSGVNVGGSATSTLLADGRVLIEQSAGDRERQQQRYLFDPPGMRLGRTVVSTFDDHVEIAVAETRPAPNATDVPTSAAITVRFSKPVALDTLTLESVVLASPEGVVPTQLVPAENGRLLFIRPRERLSAETRYTVTLTGVLDVNHEPLKTEPTAFTTVAANPAPAETDTESWVPEIGAQRRGWKANREPSPWRQLPPLQAPIGVTALAGQVLTLDGRPLPNVTMSIGEERTETDRTGRFLLKLSKPPVGRVQLAMDGETANRGNRRYGFFEYGLSMTPGTTTVLPFTIWMPRLDTANEITITSPTTRDVAITTPLIPGLELRLPRGTVIRGRDGRVVRRVGITAIPVDRPPFPLARNVDVPIYFTIQPGSAYVTVESRGARGASLVYPNYHGAVPGQLAQFFHYDPDVRDWYVYGTGQISADGRQGIPSEKTRLYQFTGAMFTTGSSPAPAGPTPGGPPVADPVDPSTGIFTDHKVDLYIKDVMPLVLTRTYNSADNVIRPMGRGMTHPYAMFLWSALQYEEVDLVLPEGGKIHYVRTSPGTGWTDAVFTTSVSPTRFYKSVITWNGDGWNLTLKDGTVYVFGENAPLQAIRDRHGNTVTITHASGQTGNVTKVTSPNGRSLSFAYDGSDRVTSVTDHIGRSVSYTYDGNGNLSTVTDPESGVTTYTYTGGHQIETIEDARNIVYVTNEYTSGRVTHQTMVDGEYELSYTVDGGGAVTHTDVTDPRGNVERFAFNADHYITSITQALGEPEERTWSLERQSGSNLVTAATDELGRRTERTYDSSGHLLTETRLAGTGNAVTTTYTYEPIFFQLATVTDPLSHTWTVAYDANAKPISITNPLSQTTAIATDATGQLTSVTDPLSQQWQLGYGHGDLTSITNPLTAVTSLFSDAVGRVVASTDPLGRQTRTVYDALNRPTDVTDANGGVTELGYDANSNLVSLTDALSHTTTYDYDNSDRVETRTDPLTHAETYAYDSHGNVTLHTDRKGQETAFAYDALNRLATVTYDDTSTVTYTYDAGDRVIEIDDSANGTITREYDDLDRLTEETTPLGVVSYTYDAAGRRTSMTVAGQATVSYGYDHANQLTSITQGSAAVAITYDAAGRRSTLTYPNGIVATYGYDAASQLTSLAYTLSGTPIGDLTYTYDAAGQRTSVGGSLARSGLPAALASATYNAGNQLTAWGATSISHDVNGNLTNDGTNAYTWNARNQLSAMSGGVSASFAYEGTGRRRAKTVGGTTTQFLYDGWNAVQELTSGTPTANLLQGLGIDETFVRTDGAGARALLPDALGSTLELADNSGTLQTHYTYEPFGTTAASGTSSTNAAQFTGRERDGTGAYFNRARYYHPQLQRFLSEDPLGVEGGLNLYAYAGNNPVSQVDPLGLKPEPPYGGGPGGGPNPGPAGGGGGGDDNGPDPSGREGSCPGGPDGWYRPASHPYRLGRTGSHIEPESVLGRWLENNIPAAHAASTAHDLFMDRITKRGGRDWIWNIPTMPIIYGYELQNQIARSFGHPMWLTCH